jgi:hypothetical protein
VTTVINFAPSAVQPFQFSATLDGQQYNVVCPWNIFRGPNNSTQGFYIAVYDLSGNLIVSRALSGSAIGINLQSLAWNNGTVTATTVTPHGYKVGKSIPLAISGASPDGFNGLYQCYITGPSTFTFALATNPGAATAFGSASFDVDLTGGYFVTSRLVYRTPNRQFEISQ